jgi:hypothetical protein
MKSNFLAAADDCGDVKVSIFPCMTLFFLPIASKFIVLEVGAGYKLITKMIYPFWLYWKIKVGTLFSQFR